MAIKPLILARQVYHLDARFDRLRNEHRVAEIRYFDTWYMELFR